MMQQRRAQTHPGISTNKPTKPIGMETLREAVNLRIDGGERSCWRGARCLRDRHGRRGRRVWIPLSEICRFRAHYEARAFRYRHCGVRLIGALAARPADGYSGADAAAVFASLGVSPDRTRHAVAPSGGNAAVDVHPGD
jgi:hypothetical protein